MINPEDNRAFAQLERRKARGTLIIIGGREDREGDCLILQEVVKRLHGTRNRLVVVTIATNYPDEVFKEYQDAFTRLGVKHIDLLDARTREDAYRPEYVELIDKASVVFFTGGDQLRITSQLGDSPLYRHLANFYHEGGTIVGTSAGAAAMSDMMLFAGPSDESNKVSALGMAPGLGLLHQITIDTHFAERGRMGRLLGVVSQNPRTMGLGIDENTSIIVNRNDEFRVLGSGAVYVLDGSTITYSSLSEQNPDGLVSLFDVRLHVLRSGDCFNLLDRRPITTVEGMAARRK